jgi:hypothetical protein
MSHARKYWKVNASLFIEGRIRRDPSTVRSPISLSSVGVLVVQLAVSSMVHKWFGS